MDLTDDDYWDVIYLVLGFLGICLVIYLACCSVHGYCFYAYRNHKNRYTHYIAFFRMLLNICTCGIFYGVEYFRYARDYSILSVHNDDVEDVKGFLLAMDDRKLKAGPSAKND